MMLERGCFWPHKAPLKEGPIGVQGIREQLSMGQALPGTGLAPAVPDKALLSGNRCQADWVLAREGAVHPQDRESRSSKHF